MSRQLYSFRRTRNGEKEWGIVYGDSPDQAMQQVLGSHPTGFGVTYAFVYLSEQDNDPNSDYSLEWIIEKEVTIDDTHLMVPDLIEKDV